MTGKGVKKTSSDLRYLEELDDKKHDKAKQKVLKSESSRERKEALQESKRVQRKKQAQKEDKVSWRTKAGGLCALVFIFGAGFFSAVSTIMSFAMGSGIVNLDVRDSGALKNVLFSGEPWLVYCVNNDTAAHRLPRALEESTRHLGSTLGVKVGVLPCWDPTESGRSVAQRFKLKSSPPLAFFVANGNAPRVVNLVGVSKAEDLEKKLKPAMKVETGRIDTLKKWPALCTSRRACVVVGHKNSAQRDTALNIFKPLLTKHRGVKVNTLDTSFWSLKLDEGILARRPQKSSGRADVLCLARSDSAAGNQTHSGTFLQDLDATSAASFMQACEQRQDLVAITVPPKIAAKPSKPRVVTPPEPSRAQPSPSPRPASSPKRANVDRVGSRATMEQQDALFEAIEEEEEEDGDAASKDADEDSEFEGNEETDGDEGESAEEVEL